MDLDFEGMYASFKERKTKGEVLDLIQICASILEFFVGYITKEYIKKYDTKKDIKKLHTFKQKINYLKSKGIIDSKLYDNLTVLSRIRNKIFHSLFTNKTIFDSLNEIKCDNDFIRNIKSDSRKYQLIVSYCSGLLFEIGDIIFPEKTLHLESTEDTKFEPVKDGFS